MFRFLKRLNKPRGDKEIEVKRGDKRRGDVENEVVSFLAGGQLEKATSQGKTCKEKK